MSASATLERPVIIEGRTITTVAEMLEFCLAAVAVAGVKPEAIRLHVAQDMRVAEYVLADGRKVHDVLVSWLAEKGDPDQLGHEDWSGLEQYPRAALGTGHVEGSPPLSPQCRRRWLVP